MKCVFSGDKITVYLKDCDWFGGILTLFLVEQKGSYSLSKSSVSLGILYIMLSDT